ncbi:family 1 glycosylhydrolase [Spirosoma sordidisoli]|uniref:Glycosyl hydrolase family protein n=1 Tax=Spirosoma sordidisoli TaxID=2502893 RepID=A0A4Q2UK55_9BACT|nr:family 1 glycosylhydrolase [Spirosoma sordidisoli]RYC68001.1 glycosyl hydrolase family protein [Spirosoma sordidisoli]
MSIRIQKKTVDATPASAKVALWGGIECTVNRVGDVYQDQISRSGHHDRLSDLDAVAELGIRTLRYPVLWERTAPDHPDSLDWRWPDERLNRLRALGIRPIVGLVHHGCGPRYATFDTPAFDRELPRYARQVAERYPWVQAYTPVNEPLTTARFSGLYGIWYPHGRSDKQFVAILLRQLRATVLAMAQIRAVQPAAQLVQTDDLGCTHSTPKLRYQADFENERRWLTWDLLSGRVTPGHALWSYLRRSGASERDLWFHVENPCPPSLLGINHYVTSERYLDEDLTRHGAWTHGSNGRHRYADTEIVRANPAQRLGIAALLCQAWERYRLPMAITEAHLGCTVDEQQRWLGEVWQQAEAARRAGADIRAVTAWALLGLYDWHNLLTRVENRHEPGVFDLSSGRPEPTELTDMVRQLALGRPVDTLVPPGLGWWQAKQTVKEVLAV